MLRHLRVPELAFWVAAVLVLVGALLVAVHLGSNPRGPQGDGVAVAAVPSPETSKAREQVETLLSTMQAGVADGSDVEALAMWGAIVMATADEGAKARAAEGAGADDALLQDLTALSQLSRQLVSTQDKVAAVSLRTQIGLSIQHAAALVNGQPAAQLPGGSLDPLGSNGARPTQPRPSTPDQPTTPQLPKEND